MTRIISVDLVDAAMENARVTQRRIRLLPSRVVVYLLLAGALFAGLGYRQVWGRSYAPVLLRCVEPGMLLMAVV